jgi:hypothetical protein
MAALLEAPPPPLGKPARVTISPGRGDSGQTPGTVLAAPTAWATAREELATGLAIVLREEQAIGVGTVLREAEWIVSVTEV